MVVCYWDYRLVREQEQFPVLQPTYSVLSSHAVLPQQPGEVMLPFPPLPTGGQTETLKPTVDLGFERSGIVPESGFLAYRTVFLIIEGSLT